MLTLEVTPRGKEVAAMIREGGLVPAVCYGPKQEATSFSADARNLEQVWRQAGETTIVVLKGLGEDKETLIRDVQFHPVSGAVLHADFYVLEKGKKIRVSVPLQYIGQAPAEKAGGIISKAVHEIEIEVAPAELPHHLEADLSKLANIGSHITVGDIPLPPSARLITDGEEIVASATAFVEEKETTVASETVILTAKQEVPAAGGGAAPVEEKK